MDIRNFFNPKAKQNKFSNISVPVINDDDDDFKSKKKKKGRGNRRLMYESDEDEIPENTNAKKPRSDESSMKPNKKKPAKTEISCNDFFGSDPIKRSETLPVASSAASSRRSVKRSKSPDIIPESPTYIEESDDEPMEKVDGKMEESSTLNNPPPAKKLKLLVQKESYKDSEPLEEKSGPRLAKSEPEEIKSEPVKKEPSPVAKKTPSKELVERRQSPRKHVRANSSSSTTPEKHQSPRKPVRASSSNKTTPEKHQSSGKRTRANKSSSTTPVKHQSPGKRTRANKSSSTTPVKTTKKQSESPKDTKNNNGQQKKEPATPLSTKPPVAAPATTTPKPSRSDSYRAYLNRGGPKAPGSKEIPEGAANCLAGLTIVFTGVGESLDKDDSTELAKKYGAKVTSSVSRKTNYLVCGDGAGEKKLAQAKEFGCKIINEDEFLDLIKNSPAKKESAVNSSTSKGKKGNKRSSSTSSKPKRTPPPSSNETVSIVTSPTSDLQSSLTSPDIPKGMTDGTCSTSSTGGSTNYLMWVDKHSPVSTSQIIGQKGERSNVKKLAKWLREWFDYHGVNPTRKSQFTKGKEDCSMYKAALLSGPPGIGKTTSATLVCKEEGFTYTEMNASACRGRKALQTEVASSLDNMTMDGFLTGGGGVEAGKRHVLIMDEVDGMAGTEDRGGVQELIQLIKTSSIPIICICNDRQHIKIRSLANYCYDLRFYKPKVEQIKGSMMSIAFKEGIKIAPQALHELIVASNNDIRQVLHNLSLWTAADKSLTMKESVKAGKKDLKMSPFDVVRSVFMPVEGNRELTLNEKAGLFFHDYSFGPLFVQENYLKIKSAKAKNIHELLQGMSDAADSIAYGDLVSKTVRAESQWALLPVQAMYSSVLPGEYMRGTLWTKPDFPQWLGNNSRQGKFSRNLQELQQHTRLACSCDRTEFGMEYLPVLHNRLTQPLLEKGSDGAEEVVSLLEQYDLTRDDWDNIMELAKYSGRGVDVMSQIDSKTKAAFTRTYNKSSHSLPYQSLQTTGSVKKKPRMSVTDEFEEGEEEQGSDLEDNNQQDNSQNAEIFLVKPRKASESKTSTKSRRKK